LGTSGSAKATDGAASSLLIQMIHFFYGYLYWKRLKGRVGQYIRKHLDHLDHWISHTVCKVYIILLKIVLMEQKRKSTMRVQLKQNRCLVYKIESGIPIPKNQSKSKYPFSQMNVGDSIFFSGADSQSSPVKSAKSYFKRKGQKCLIKREGDGMRVWRTE
jgi:hypothetical protein